MSNKTRTAALAATALFTLALLPGAVMDLVQPEMVTDVAENLSMPLHILTLVGIWKWLGIIALWQPRQHTKCPRYFTASRTMREAEMAFQVGE